MISTASTAWINRTATFVLDALLPPQCLGCAAPVDGSGQLCVECWRNIDFIAAPFCACCGLPFDFDVGEGAICAACVQRPPAYDRARAVFRYDDNSRGLVLGFKHGDRTEAAPSFGAWLARAGSELLADCDLIAPVPLHRWRLLRRRYNQSALLARALHKAAKPIVPDLLQRSRATPSQGGLSASERRRNVRGAFKLRQGYQTLVEGRRILLIDDVLTTGATVESCARILKRAGVQGVDVLTLARVVRGRTETI